MNRPLCAGAICAAILATSSPDATSRHTWIIVCGVWLGLALFAPGRSKP